jgi:hypothetical protein
MREHWLTTTVQCVIPALIRHDILRSSWFMAVMQEAVQTTVKLYLDGKIREWYSRGDGKGVVVLLDVKTEEEARAIEETLPLTKAQLMDHQYIPVGPLMPLRALNPAALQ